MKCGLCYFLFVCGILNAEWSQPAPISSGSADVDQRGSPLIINPCSTATAGWYDISGGSVQSISSASLTASGSEWSTPIPIVSASSASVPFLTLGQMGCKEGALAGFGQMVSSDSFSVNVSKKVCGNSTWQIPIAQLGMEIPGEGAQDSDCFGNFGAIIPVLNTPPNPNWNIYLFQFRSDENQWKPITLLGQDDSPFPSVAIRMMNGQGIVAWATDLPQLQILTQRYDYSAQTSSAISSILVPEGSVEVRNIKVKTDCKGNSVLTFQAVASLGEQRLYASTLFSNQTSWSIPILISDGDNQAADDDLAMGFYSGTAYILWIEQLDQPLRQVVRVATLPLGGTPQCVTDLTGRNNPLARIDVFPKIAIDLFDNVATLWVFRQGAEESLIQMALKRCRCVWTRAQTLATGGDSALLALNNQGAGVVTWLADTTDILMGIRNNQLFPLQSPTLFEGELLFNQFLTQKTCSLKMNWNHSPASNVVAYEIYRNGQLLVTLPRSGNRTSNEWMVPFVKGRYELVTVASNGNKSLPFPLSMRR